MAHTTSMKQLGSRNIGCVIERMEWSDKMDLVALGNEKGEVIVQRLNWQKIVTFPTPGEGVRVNSLSWQSDEPIVAAGYSNGKVALLDIEREDVVFSLTYEESIAKVYFSKVIHVKDYKHSYRAGNDPTHESYLSQLPPLTSAGSTVKSSHDHKTFSKSSPCFLIVLLKSGKLHLLLLGALKTGSIELSAHVNHADDFFVFDVYLSHDFHGVYALVRDGNELKVLHFKNEVLETYLSPILQIALRCANILEIKSYINDTIQCMSEAWETVLMEMDNKLTKYANAQPEGSISADFLELLVCGYASLEIEEFLMDELTEKGVKKLATSVDLSCSTLQSLVMRSLIYAANNLFYFLNTINGLSRNEYFFSHLINQSAAEQAMRLCGSFMLKIQELQQVIDQCIYDIKLFFNWLSIVIVRLRQQDLPEESSQLTPEDTIYLAEYLYSFEESIIENADGSVTKRKFNLEKVGQYLENRNLTQITKADANDLWHKLLEENECLKKNSLLLPHDRQTSLIQEREALFTAIDEIFKKPDESISSSFELDASIICHQQQQQAGKLMENNLRCCHFTTSSGDEKVSKKQSDLIVTTLNAQECFVLEFEGAFKTLHSTRIQLLPGPMTSLADFDANYGNLAFVDIKFYNENTLSLLLRGLEERGGDGFGDRETKTTHFAQFALDTTRHRSVQHQMPQHINLTEMSVAHSFLDKFDHFNFKNLSGEFTNLAVSGSRKVASITSESCTKLTIFEMEVEDDEDDTEMSQNSCLEISKESTEC